MSEAPETITVAEHESRMLLQQTDHTAALATMQGTLDLSRAGLNDADGIATAQMFYGRVEADAEGNKPTITDWFSGLTNENAPKPLRGYLPQGEGGKAPATPGGSGGGLGGKVAAPGVKAVPTASEFSQRLEAAQANVRASKPNAIEELRALLTPG